MDTIDANRLDPQDHRARTGPPRRFLAFAALVLLGSITVVLCGLIFFTFRSNPRVYAVALGDLDEDGDLDAFYVNGESEAPQASTVLFNRGGAQGGRMAVFQDSGQRLGNWLSRKVVLDDLDGDGDLDAWVAHSVYTSLYINAGRGIFQNPRSSLGDGEFYGSGMWDVALGDMDGDGDLDALWGGCCGTLAYGEAEAPVPYPPYNLLWINPGGEQGGKLGDFADSGQTLESLGAESAALGDLDDDGDPDAFFGNHYLMDKEGELDLGQPNTVWWNDGHGRLEDSGQRLGSARTFDVALGDLDGDGDVDAYNANHGPDEVWINAGGRQGGQPGFFIDSGQRLGEASSRQVSLADLDGDGDLDAAISIDGRLDHRTALEIRLNDGQGNFPAVSQRIAPWKAQAFALGDLDEDGDLDVFAAWYENQYTIWWNRGDGNFKP